MDRTDSEFFEQMITLTAYPEWSVLVKDLETLIYHAQANAFELSSWEDVKKEEGFARGLAYIINFRDTIKKAQSLTAREAEMDAVDAAL